MTKLKLMFLRFLCYQMLELASRRWIPIRLKLKLIFMAKPVCQALHRVEERVIEA